MGLKRNMDMNHTYSFHKILNELAQGWGLYGVSANPGFGTSTLMMQLVEEFNARKEGVAVVVSLDMSEDRWIERMQQKGLSTDRLLISDNIDVTGESFEALINQAPLVSAIFIDYYELLDKAVQKCLPEIANKYKLPIIVNGKLGRDSGDYDPELRPELYTVLSFRDRGEGNKVWMFNFLTLMHRKHKCDRNIGTAHRYDISNETELIIKRNLFGALGSAYMEWDEDNQKFEF